MFFNRNKNKSATLTEAMLDASMKEIMAAKANNFKGCLDALADFDAIYEKYHDESAKKYKDGKMAEWLKKATDGLQQNFGLSFDRVMYGIIGTLAYNYDFEPAKECIEGHVNQGYIKETHFQYAAEHLADFQKEMFNWN